jgi:hypothetical protein
MSIAGCSWMSVAVVLRPMALWLERLAKTDRSSLIAI